MELTYVCVKTTLTAKEEKNKGQIYMKIQNTVDLSSRGRGIK